MKNGLNDIVGKQIAGVVVAKNDGRAPHIQVFLVFSDGTRFEFYGGDFSCCSGLDRAEGIDRYVLSAHGEIERVYGEVAAGSRSQMPLTTGPTNVRYEASGSGDLEQLMSRELKAWQEAKAAIARAKARG